MATVGIRQAITPDRLVDNETAVTPDGTVYRQRVAVAPALERVLLDYATRTDGSPVYVGKNRQAAATTDNTWVIQRFTYDSSSRPTDVQVLTGVWNDRATLSWA